MTNQLDLTVQQIATLNQITANGTTNFPAGYKYISELIKDSSSVDSYTKFFFSGAAEVNSNVAADSNLYIREVTEARDYGDSALNRRAAGSDAGWAMTRLARVVTPGYPPSCHPARQWADAHVLWRAGSRAPSRSARDELPGGRGSRCGLAAVLCTVTVIP